MKGLLADIIPSKLGGNFSNGGLSSKARQVTIVGTLTHERGSVQWFEHELPEHMQQVEPSDEAPPVLLDLSHVILRFVPALLPYPPNLLGPMMGGCHVDSDAADFRQLLRDCGATGSGYRGKVPLHDRYESRAQYAASTAGD